MDMQTCFSTDSNSNDSNDDTELGIDLNLAPQNTVDHENYCS